MIDITQPEIIKMWVECEQGENEKYLIRFSPQETLEKKSEFERLDFMLLDWAGVEADGKKIDCTTENKMKFFLWDIEQNDAARYWWIYSKAITMTTFIDMSRTLKNLKAPFTGESTSRKPTGNGATNAN